MHEHQLSERIIGAAIEVHKCLGPGLLESVHEEALCHELSSIGLSFCRQQRVPIHYKGVKLATPLRLDLIVEQKVIVDVKAKTDMLDVDKQQILTYLRLSDLRLGLLLIFDVVRLKDGGIHRVVNKLLEK